ncbi:MAG: PQQ-binding-like beta-propeller repeat protein [Planctomycetota bacterium]|jgi:outer membrane protein assembly factor BamB
MHRTSRRFPKAIRRLFDTASLAFAAVFTLAVPAVADDWPFFRGPAHNGVSAESGWTARWPASGPKVAWRADVGVGASSVVVVGSRLITMGNRKDKDEDVVWCLDATSGRVLWQFTYPSKFDARQFEGGTASTPTVDGPLVYTLGYEGQVHCLGLDDGRTVWHKHLVDDFGGRYSSWKYAGSPLATGGLVIFDTGADGNSTVALDKTSGRKVWGVGHDLAGYATPIPFKHAGRRGVLVFKARAMVAHDLATGRELWRIGWKTYYDCNASTPTVVGDKLFISTGYGGRSARGALFQLGDGEPRQMWLNQDLETKMNSAVVYEGHVYCVSEKSGGQLMCFDLSDGAVVWADPSFARYGTLMIAGGKLVVLDEEGELVIADATPDGYRELARAKVLNSRCWVMPVLARGRIYAKSNKGELVCLDVRAESGE